MAEIVPPQIHETLRPPPWAADFWGSVNPATTSSCWLWGGAMTGAYGQFMRSTWGTARAHRITYMWANGPIPYGKVVDHLCRNTRCVNPAHLEAITDRENILRGVGLPAVNARATHCTNGHPLVEANLYESYLARGERQCRICGRDRARQKHYERATDSPNAGQCASCGRILHVRRDGGMHKHYSEPGVTCAGSGHPPMEASA